MDTLLKHSLIFTLMVRDEQKEAGEYGDQVYITMANGIINEAKKQGLIVEREGIELVLEPNK